MEGRRRDGIAEPMGAANYNTGGVVCLIVRSFKVVRATSVNECTLLSTLALIVAAGEDTSMHMMRAHRPRHFFSWTLQTPWGATLCQNVLGIKI